MGQEPVICLDDLSRYESLEEAMDAAIDGYCRYHRAAPQPGTTRSSARLASRTPGNGSAPRHLGEWRRSG